MLGYHDTRRGEMKTARHHEGEHAGGEDLEEEPERSWLDDMPDRFHSAYRDELLNLYLSMVEQCKACGYPLLRRVTFHAFCEFAEANS